MKRNLLFGALGTVLALALFVPQLNAQPQGTQIVFIDAQRAIASHPAGEQLAQLREQAQTEIASLRSDLDPIVTKLQSGQQLTAQERELYDTLIRSLEAVQQRWRNEIGAASTPAIEAVNAAIEQIAQTNGYSMVLDGNVAGQNGLGLVVYAEEELDITDLVIERIR